MVSLVTLVVVVMIVQRVIRLGKGWENMAYEERLKELGCLVWGRGGRVETLLLSANT